MILGELSEKLREVIQIFMSELYFLWIQDIVNFWKLFGFDILLLSTDFLA
jgi:hypothetical protein